MKLKLKLPGAGGPAVSGQAEPSTSTLAPAAQPTISTAATPSRKRKEPSVGGGLDAESADPSVPPAKRPATSVSMQPPQAGAAGMPPPRLKIALPGARAAAAAAAAAAGAAAPSPSGGLPPRPVAPAGPGPSSSLAGQAPLPAAAAARGGAGATAKGRLSEEARKIAMHVNQAFADGTNGGPAGDGLKVKLPGGPGPPAGPAVGEKPQLIAPLPSGEGPAIKKIKLSVKMPNLASLAARIARGEPTGPEDGGGAAAGGATVKAGGAAGTGGGAAAAPGAGGRSVRGVDADGGGGSAVPPAARPGAPATGAGPPRLPFKLKIPSLAGGGAGAAAAGGAGGAAGATTTTTTTKPMITTTTRPAVVTTKPAAAAAAGLDDDEDDDYGPDPDFALPRRGRGRGRGRGTRGASAAGGRGSGSGGGAGVPGLGRGGSAAGGRGAAAAAASVSTAVPSAPVAGPAPPMGGAGRGRGRSSDYAGKFDLERCFEQIVKQDKDGLFAKPVTDELAPGYSEVIKNPIDLSMIRERLRNGHYDSWGSLEADLLLMTNNAKTYNPEGSNAWWHADLMEKMTLKYISCGRSGMQNYRGVAASVWRDLRKPAEGNSAIPLLPRYTSAGPRLDKNGNERDPAERRRQQQEANAETASLMLESRLRERRPGPGALRDDVVLWPTNTSDPRAGGPSAGAPGLGGMGAAGSAGGFGLGAGGAGPGRRKYRTQGMRMIEADARRLMAAQAGDNRFSYRSKPPISVAPFVNMGGLANGASPEGLPYAVVRPSLQPAYQPCDSVPDAYASSIARFMAKCGKMVQSAIFKRLQEPPPPPPPDPVKLAQEALQQQQQQQQQAALIQQAAAVLQQQQRQQQQGLPQQQLAGMPGQAGMSALPAAAGSSLPLPLQLSQQQQPQQPQAGPLPIPGQAPLPLPGQQQAAQSLPLPSPGSSSMGQQSGMQPGLLLPQQQSQPTGQPVQSPLMANPLEFLAGQGRTPTPPPLQQGQGNPAQQGQNLLSGGLLNFMQPQQQAQTQQYTQPQSQTLQAPPSQQAQQTQQLQQGGLQPPSGTQTPASGQMGFAPSSQTQQMSFQPQAYAPTQQQPQQPSQHQQRSPVLAPGGAAQMGLMQSMPGGALQPGAGVLQGASIYPGLMQGGPHMGVGSAASFGTGAGGMLQGYNATTPG